MSLFVFLEIIAYLSAGLIIVIKIWPHFGFYSLTIISLAAFYLIVCWFTADKKVAGKAGFRRPTPVQERYLEYLGIEQNVFTHPSTLPAAGTLASWTRQSIFLSSGVFNKISEDEMRQLITQLSTRNKSSVFCWTFHLATGGAGLFKRSGSDDPAARWGRRILMTGAMSGIMVTATGFLIAAAVSPMFGRAIDVSPIIPLYWVPTVFLAARFVWRRINAAVIGIGAGNWNKPIALGEIDFMPMIKKSGGHHNLDLLRSGLLIAGKRRSDFDS